MFTPIKNTKVYECVVKQIKLMINMGALKKGDKLPTEREMAEQLQVSRASVREALRALEVIGLTESRQGAGNFIKESFEGALFEPLSIMFTIENSTGDDIYEIREILELETVKLAAVRINEEELMTMKEAVEEMMNCDDEDRNIELDKKFHYTIAKASRNMLIINFLQVISELIDEFIKDSRSKILVEKNNRHRLMNIHYSIYEALNDRNPDKAYKCMKEHFVIIREYMK